MSEPAKNELRRKLRAFRDNYERISQDGYCDSPGGCEYRRVREEFLLAGCPNNVEQFIRWRANAGPLEKEVAH
jgi:hypothetical protein